MAINVYVESEGNSVGIVEYKKFFFDIVSFEDGIVEIDPIYATFIGELAPVVEHLLKDESNFERVLKENFHCNGVLKGIKFVFNDVPMTVMKENADGIEIVDEYFSKWNEFFSKQ